MSNPALNDNIFQREIQAAGNGTSTRGINSPASELPPGMFDHNASTQQVGAPTSGGPIAATDTMRLGGTLSATAILLALLVVAGWFGWQAVTVTDLGVKADGSKNVSSTMPPWLMLSWIAGFGIAIFTVFKPKLARFTGPLFAIAEGLLLGAISRAYEIQFEGIVGQAVALTVGVFVVMLVLFATGTVKVTDKTRTMIVAATGAILLVYVVSIVLSFFGTTVPMIHDSGPVGIGFSLLVVGIAAFNLLLDFDFIDRGVRMGAPRYMEWFAAFGLMITLVWLYLEILRLLGKLRSN